MIFVFGSNLRGIHGAGAAAFAVKHHGAIFGQGIGLQGDSYGIPTKDGHLYTLPLDRIQKYVEQFVEFASQHPELEFVITPVGCGLAGYKRPQIRPMFAKAEGLKNCKFADTWLEKE